MSDTTAITDLTQQTDQSSSTDDQSTEDISGLKSALDKERSAARDASRALRQAQARIAEFENRDKSDTERLTAERDALKEQAETTLGKLQIANARAAITEAATKANAVSPRAVFALVREDITYDDEGEPTNVAALIKAAQADEPSLFRKSGGRGDGGEGGGTTQPGTNDQMNEFIRANARRRG